MAGDWFPVRNNLPRDPVVIKIARELSRIRHTFVTTLSHTCSADVTTLFDLRHTKAEVIGALVTLWGWADDETEDGCFEGIDLEDLPELLGSDLNCWIAIANAGWITQTANGLRIPSFDKYLGNSAKKRIKAAERQRESRSRHKSVTKTSRSKCDKSVTTEQNRREEKRRVCKDAHTQLLVEVSEKCQTSPENPHVPEAVEALLREEIHPDDVRQLSFPTFWKEPPTPRQLVDRAIAEKSKLTAKREAKVQANGETERRRKEAAEREAKAEADKREFAELCKRWQRLPADEQDSRIAAVGDPRKIAKAILEEQAIWKLKEADP